MFNKILYCLFVMLCLANISPATAATQDFTIKGDHSHIAAILQTPDGKNQYPLVILMHGFTAQKENSLLKQIADNLEVAGIASIRFDFNGHGASGGDFKDMTVLNEIEDARKIYQYAEKLPQVTSISLSGHSQGGLVASMFAGELGTNKINSVALLAPAAVIRDNARNSNMLNFPLDANFLPEYVEVFGRRIGRNYILTARELPIYETAKKFHGPVLIVHGEADDIVPYTYGETYNQIYSNSELKLLPNFDHSFSQDKALVAKIVSDFFVDKLQ